jgi:hypothetical protein
VIQRRIDATFFGKAVSPLPVQWADSLNFGG